MRSQIITTVLTAFLLASSILSTTVRGETKSNVPEQQTIDQYMLDSTQTEKEIIIGEDGLNQNLTKVGDGNNTANYKSYGDKVVWQIGEINNGSDSNIILYDITTGKQTQITTDGKSKNPYIYGDTLVYQKFNYADENISDIYTYDIKTGNEQRVTSTPGKYRLGGINGDRVLWQQGFPEVNGEWFGEIAIYDIKMEKLIKTISISEKGLGYVLSVNSNPMDGNLIVLESQHDSTEDDIGLYDISTDTFTKITYREDEDDITDFLPSISGDKIVWMRPDFDQDTSHVILYDRSKGEYRQISEENERAFYPIISGDKVIWQEEPHAYPNQSISHSIVIYDINTGEKTKIRNIDPEQRTAFDWNSFDGEKIVFRSNPSKNILMYQLEGDVSPTNPGNPPGEEVPPSNKKTVFFLPGISGTEIYKGSNRLWLPDLNELIDNFQYLSLKPDGSSMYGDVYADKPIEQYYKKIIDELENYDEDDDGVSDLDVHVFGYDWRLSNKINADKLRYEIEKLNVDKVSIVAHSMGGLVASKYIADSIANGYSKKVDKLITIGTPYLGSPKGLYVFETGKFAGDYRDAAISKGIKEIAPNMSSVYQLLPSRGYFDINNTFYVRQIIENGWFERDTINNFETYDDTKDFLLKQRTEWVNPVLLEEADDFQQTLDIASTLNSVDSFIIAGYGKKTNGLITEYFWGKDNSKTYDFDPIDGDGTVPLISATLGGEIDKGLFSTYYEGNRKHTYFIKGVEHSELAADQTVINQVLQIVNGHYLPVAGMDDKAKLSKSLKVRVESPVDLHVYDQNGNHLGLGDNDLEEENISSGTYNQSGHTKTVLLEYGNYNVRLLGTGNGTATIILQEYDELNQLMKTVRFDNIEVTPQTIMTTNTDMDGRIQLNFDKNGDGNIQILEPSTVLDSVGSSDQTPPSISYSVDGEKSEYDWYKSDVALSIHAEDQESDVNSIEYRINDGEIQDYDKTLKISKEGKSKIDAVAINNNRLKSNAITTNINIDKTAPELNISFDPSLKKFIVKSQDSLSGAQTGNFTVTPTKTKDNLGKYISDLQSKVTDLNFNLKEIGVYGDKQVFNIKDKANNLLEITLSAKSTSNSAILKILKLKYNGVEVSVPNNIVAVSYIENNRKIVHLQQVYYVKNQLSMKAIYNTALNQTMISDTFSSKKYLIKKPGLVLLSMDSNKGKFNYNK